MKKSFLFLMLAGGLTAAAQVDQTQANTNTNTTSHTTMNQDHWNKNADGTYRLLSTGDYSAYSAPSHVQLYFTRDYPTVNTTVNWMPIGEYWRASYNDAGRYSHVFYTSSGDNFMVALPVTQSWVPDDVITAASNMYGGSVYDITMLKGYNNANVYQVRFLNGNEITSEWLNDQGVKVTEYYRTEELDKMHHHHMYNPGQNQTQLNLNTTEGSGSEIKEMKIKTEGDETKIKIETEDGKKTKTKIKNDQ